MKRIYIGNYFQVDLNGNEIPFRFRMDVELNEKLSFTGKVWEDEFSGLSGKELTVKGYIDEDHISFVKQYPCAYEIDENGEVLIDESRKGHHVIYDGYWDEVNGCWLGEWEVEGDTAILTPTRIHTQVFLARFEMKQMLEGNS